MSIQVIQARTAARGALDVALHRSDLFATLPLESPTLYVDDDRSFREAGP